jgi:hypothetical protein
MSEKIHLCLKHMGIIKSDIEVFTSQVGECYICAEQSACYIEYPVEIEIPADRLKILE